jgi:hypothetical protein
MIEIITAIAGPLISGLIALYVSTTQNDKTVALIQYRLEQLEAKVDSHNHLNDRLIKLETKIDLLEKSKHEE